MVTYRRPPSLKDQLVRARITQPTHSATQGCKRPNSCKYCKKISQSGKIKNTLNNKNYNTMRNGTCQSNNLIYYIECNWCQTKYVGQTRNRIIDNPRVIYLTSNTIITPQWPDTLDATKIILIQI